MEFFVGGRGENPDPSIFNADRVTKAINSKKPIPEEFRDLHLAYSIEEVRRISNVDITRATGLLHLYEESEVVPQESVAALHRDVLIANQELEKSAQKSRDDLKKSLEKLVVKNNELKVCEREKEILRFKNNQFEEEATAKELQTSTRFEKMELILDQLGRQLDQQGRQLDQQGRLNEDLSRQLEDLTSQKESQGRLNEDLSRQLEDLTINFNDLKGTVDGLVASTALHVLR